MRLMATLDFFIRMVAVLATFVVVRGPADTWRALALQAAASFFSLIMSICLSRWKNHRNLKCRVDLRFGKRSREA